MELEPASVEQIAIFKRAAARRYAERGIPPAQAEQLFNKMMDKLSSDLGVKPVSPKIQKIASELKRALGK